MAIRLNDPSLVPSAGRGLRWMALPTLLLILAHAIPVAAESAGTAQPESASNATVRLETTAFRLSMASNSSVDPLSGPPPAASANARPPLLAVRSDLPLATVETVTPVVQGVSLGRSAPRVFFGGLGIALLCGLTVLAGINSRKRWPSMTTIRST